MDSSSDTELPAAGAGGVLDSDCFASQKSAVYGFVNRHFTWPGTLLIHRAAIGWDIIRAPLNVALSLVLVLTRIAALVARILGLRRLANWLMGRQILLRASVARRVEALVLTDLLDLPTDPDGTARDRHAVVAPIVSSRRSRIANQQE